MSANPFMKKNVIIPAIIAAIGLIAVFDAYPTYSDLDARIEAVNSLGFMSAKDPASRLSQKITGSMLEGAVAERNKLLGISIGGGIAALIGGGVAFRNFRRNSNAADSKKKSV